jgi:hypothetical protein
MLLVVLFCIFLFLPSINCCVFAKLAAKGAKNPHTSNEPIFPKAVAGLFQFSYYWS